MPDMLVKLYNLPDPAPLLAELQAKGIEIRRAELAEKKTVVEWVQAHFWGVWAAETEAAMEQRPVTCLIAVQKQKPAEPPEDPYQQPPEELVGFACYDVARRGFFGPTGVHPDCRGQGIGKALLLATLQAMYQERYGYAIIYWVGPTEFYEKVAGATVIEGSEPGVARGFLVGKE